MVFFSLSYLTFTSVDTLDFRKIENRAVQQNIGNQLTKFRIFFLIPFLGMLFGLTFFESYALTDIQDKAHKITVSYTNNTANSYVIFTSNQNYTIIQPYSWGENNFMRFNLQSYSIDNGSLVPIHRNSHGNFTINLVSNSDHTIIFTAKPQFKITISSKNNVGFLPPSQTNDSWFDAGSIVQIIAPNILQSSPDTRQQLTGWSIDGSDIYVVSRQESSNFKSPAIHVSSMHTIDLDYKTQYFIKLTSNFGRALGTGWYDSGTIADISVIPGDDFLVKHEFTGWSGPVIGNGDQESANIIADSPKTLAANWFVDYTNVSIIIIIAIAILVSLRIYQKKRIVRV